MRGRSRYGRAGRGGGRNHAAKQGSALPNAAKAFHWFDLTDISVLFQDLNGLTPITADGQELVRVNNKGTSGERMHNEGSTPIFPIYKENIINGLSVARLDGTNTQHLFTANTSPITGSYTTFHVFRYDTAATPDNYSFSYGVQKMSHYVSAADGAVATMNDNTDTGPTITNGTTIGVITKLTTAGIMTTDWSNEVGTTTQLATHANLAAVRTCIGARSVDGTDPWTGDIAELVIWDSDERLQPLRNYARIRYGITWL